MKLSLIVIVYNKADYIADCLQSILPQLTGAVELIVVDDGSTDDSASIIASYGASLRYIYQENKGPGGARNTGFACACGEYVWWIDGDDQIVAGAVETLLSCIDQQPDLLMFYSDHIVQEQRQIHSHFVLKTLSNLPPMRLFAAVELFPTAVWCFLFRREMLLENNQIFPEHMLYEDDYFLLELYNQSTSIDVLGQALYSHRFREGSTMRSPVSPLKIDSLLRLIRLVHEMEPSSLSHRFLVERQYWYIDLLMRRLTELEDHSLVDDTLAALFQLVPSQPLYWEDKIGVVLRKCTYNYHRSRFIRIYLPSR